MKPPPQNIPNPNQDPEFENKISELLTMGFEREKCVAALTAAFGNTDRAVEYLINGIPQIPQGGQPSAQMGADLGGMGQQAEAVLRNIVNHPSFAQVKQVIRNDPSAIAPILQQIEQTAPELYQIIAQNPDAFQKVIMEEGGGQGMGQGMGQGGQGMVPPPPPPGAIQVTPEEAAAIERVTILSNHS